MSLWVGGSSILLQGKGVSTGVFFYLSGCIIDRSSSSLTLAWKSTIRYGMAWHGLLYIDLAFGGVVWFITL